MFQMVFWVLFKVIRKPSWSNGFHSNTSFWHLRLCSVPAYYFDDFRTRCARFYFSRIPGTPKCSDSIASFRDWLNVFFFLTEHIGRFSPGIHRSFAVRKGPPPSAAQYVQPNRCDAIDNRPLSYCFRFVSEITMLLYLSFWCCWFFFFLV